MALIKSLTTKWTTTEDKKYIGIPLCAGEYFGSTNLSLRVDWGDGQETNITDTDVLPEQDRVLFHVYETPGEKTVSIYGGYGPDDTDRRIAFQKSPTSFDARSTRDQLKQIVNWDKFYIHGQGDFRGCTILEGMPSSGMKFILSTDPSARIQSEADGTFLCISTFEGCEALNSNIENWGESLLKCTSMNSMFKNANIGKPWLGKWRPDNVTDMTSMFEGSNFNHASIGKWGEKNQPTRIGNVVSMANMFKDCPFDQFIAWWFRDSAHSIKNMSGIFSGTSEFGKGASKGADKIFHWKMYGVEDVSDMFRDNQFFDGWLAGWFHRDQSKNKSPDGLLAVKNMRGMFANSVFGRGAAKNAAAIGKWKMDTVEDTSEMFKDNQHFDYYLADWFRTSNAPAAGYVIKNMSGMFAGTSIYGSGYGKNGRAITKWDMSTVEDVSDMFRGNQHFDYFIGDWFKKTGGKTYAVKNMSGMFADSVFGKEWGRAGRRISVWDMSSVENISEMFKDNQHFDYNLGDWFKRDGTTYNVKDMSGLFENSKFGHANATSGERKTSSTAQWEMKSVETVARMFKDNVSYNGYLNDMFHWNNGPYVVTDMSQMFENAKYWRPLNQWGGGGMKTVENVSGMFAGSSDFNQDIKPWFNNVSKAWKVKNMSGMFEGNTKFNKSIDDWWVGNVEDMSSMFKNNTGYNQSLNNLFKTEPDSGFKIKNMESMFEGNTKFNNNLGDWKMHTVTSTRNMFKNSVFDKWIINWFKDPNGEKNLQIKDMSGMFSGTSAAFGSTTQNSAINNWTTTSVEDMSDMFKDNPNFDKWVKGWSTESLLSWTGFQNNNDWTAGVLTFPDDKFEPNLDQTAEIDLRAESSLTLNLKPEGGNLGTNKLLVQYHVDSDTDPGYVSVTQPANGTVSFVINNVEDGADTSSMDSSIDVTFTPNYNTITPGTETFEVKILDPNGNIATANFTITVTDTMPTPSGAPASDPVEVEFRWHDVTVSVNGEDETAKVLQVKNALEPTHASFSRDMTQWWTVYGYTGSLDYDLGNVVWADVAVASNYSAFHDATITLPDDAGSITFQADDNTGYLQANFTPGSDYEFYDEGGADGQLFMFSGDSNSDSASYDVAWPWPVRKTDAGAAPLVAGPQSGVTTPHGTVTGDLTKEVGATPNWDGYITGSLSFVDDTYGATYANNDSNQYYVMYENITGPGNYTGNIYVDLSYDYMSGQMQYSVYTDDYDNFRGDISFDIVWPNDVSADLQEQEMNGNIPGANASYSDPTNGVYITAWNEGSEMNFSVTADGVSEVWELIRDDGGPWGTGSGIEWEFDMSNSTETNDDGFATHVYPSGTVIELTGGADGGSLSPEQTEIAYNQMNRAEIRVRASEPTGGDTPGTATGDTDVTVQTTDGMFSGSVSFFDDQGTSHLTSTEHYGWYAAGVSQVSGPNHNDSGGSYGLQIRMNSLQDVGTYDYMINDQVGSYVDVYNITWYDDAGYLNSTPITITVNTPTDTTGTWSGDLNKSMARNWSEDDYNNNTGNNWGYMSGTANLSDMNNLWNNAADISTQPTHGSVEIASNSSDGNVQWEYTPTDGNVALNGNFTDSFEINWQDDLGYDNKQVITVTISQYDPSALPRINPASLIASVDAWSMYHSTNNMQTTAYINLTVDNLPVDAYIMSVNYDYPYSGMMSGNGQNLSYQPYDGEEDLTESLNVTVEWYDMTTYESGTLTGTIEVTINALPAQQDLPGSTSGTLQGTVNMNTEQNGSMNSVSSYVYYSDGNGTMNSGDPETISSPPQKGVASISYGQWTYTPNNDQVGADTFTIQWTDDIGNTNTQAITITIVDTSDQAATITGDLALTAIETPAGSTPETVSGTITIHDPNGLSNPNMSSSDSNVSLMPSTVDSTTVDVLVTYTPQVGQSQPVTVQLTWTDDHYHNGDVSFTVNFTRPAVESDVTVLDLGGTTEVTGWTFNNIDQPSTISSNDIIIKANNGVSKIVISDNDTSLNDTSDDSHPFLLADVSEITSNHASYGAAESDKLYKVNIKVDQSYDWSSQSPIDTQVTGSFSLSLFDGYDRQHTNNTSDYTYVGTNFTDQLGVAYLSDVTDSYGQTVTTQNGVSDIVLFHPAPLGNGINAGITFEDVAGVSNAASTMTVTNVDSNTLEVLTGYNAQGGPKLEMMGLGLETDGSFSIEWQDDRGVVNVSTFTYQVISLPDIAGEVSHIELPDGQFASASDGVFDISVADSNAMALTVSVEDANGVGAPSNIVQPTKGSATVVDTGGQYIVTYTPRAAAFWFEDTVKFDWADGDGNSNGTITLKFTEAIDPPHPNDLGANTVLIDVNKTQKLDNPAGDSGGTINCYLLVHDGEGMPAHDPGSDLHTIFYDQPEFTDAYGSTHGAGSVLITLAADQTISSDLRNALVADTSVPWMYSGLNVNPSGADGAYMRLYYISITLPTVTVASNPSNPHLVAEELLLDINTRIISNDYDHYTSGDVSVTPYQLQVSVIGDPGPTVKLEYSEPVDLSHLPTHDGTSSITGNVVTVTGATNFGAASDAGNSDKTTAASKLVRVQSFGRTVTNWDYAFRGSTNLTSIPFTLKGTATSMKEMFAGCTGLTNVDADAWVTDSVTSMEGMFTGCTSLIKLYADWNTSNVTNFNAMFAYTGFTNITDIVGLFPNSPTGWDLNTAATFAGMFEGSSLTSFNWTNTQIGSGLTDFSEMFKDCTSLVTVNITNLNLASATNVSGMFEGCTSLTTVTGLSDVNTHNVENFDNMFKNASALTTLNMGNIQTSSALSMKSMFEGTTSLTSITDMTQINTANIQADGLKDMYKDSGVVSTSVDISNWSGLDQLPADIAGGASTSFLILPLSLGGGNPIIPATHEISQKTIDNRIVNDLKISNYTLPDNGGKYWDWRRPYGDWPAAGTYPEYKYYILEANNGSDTIRYLLTNSPERDYQNDNTGGIHGLPQSGYFMYLVPAELDDHNGQYAPSVTTNPTSPDYETWINHPYGGLITFLDFNTPTDSELDAWLPADGNTQIDMTVKVADAAGNFETVVVSTGSVMASDLLALIQSQVTSRFSDSMDFNLSRNNYQSSGDTTVGSAPVHYPFKDGEMFASYHGGQIFPDTVATLAENSGMSATERPTFSADRIGDLLNGVYDSQHDAPKLSTLSIGSTVQPRNYYLTYNEVVDSSLTPDYEITVYSRTDHHYQLGNDGSNGYIVTIDDVPQGDGNNPSFTMSIGDRLRLERSSAGHNIAIKDSDGVIVCSGLAGVGGSDDIMFAPTKTGTYTYYCVSHPTTMTGDIVVTASSDKTSITSAQLKSSLGSVDTFINKKLQTWVAHRNDPAGGPSYSVYPHDVQPVHSHVIGSDSNYSNTHYNNEPGYHPTLDSHYTLAAPEDGKITIEYKFTNKYGSDLISHDHVVTSNYVEHTTSSATYVELEFESTDRVFIPRMSFQLPGVGARSSTYGSYSYYQGDVKTSDFAHMVIDFDPDGGSNLANSSRYYATNYDTTPIVPTGTTGVNLWHTVNWKDTISDQTGDFFDASIEPAAGWDVQTMPDQNGVSVQQLNQNWVDQYGFNNVFEALHAGNYDLSGIAENITLAQTNPEISGYHGDAQSFGDSGQYYYVYADGVQKTRKVRIYFDQTDLNSQWGSDINANINFFVRIPVDTGNSLQYQSYANMGNGQRQVFTQNNSVQIGGYLTGQISSPMYHWIGTLGSIRNYLNQSISVFGKDQSFAQGEFKLSFLDKIKTMDFSNADPMTGSAMNSFPGVSSTMPTAPGVFTIHDASERQTWIDDIIQYGN